MESQDKPLQPFSMGVSSASAYTPPGEDVKPHPTSRVEELELELAAYKKAGTSLVLACDMLVREATKAKVDIQSGVGSLQFFLWGRCVGEMRRLTGAPDFDDKGLLDELEDDDWDEEE